MSRTPSKRTVFVIWLGWMVIMFGYFVFVPARFRLSRLLRDKLTPGFRAASPLDLKDRLAKAQSTRHHPRDVRHF